MRALLTLLSCLYECIKDLIYHIVFLSTANLLYNTKVQSKAPKNINLDDTRSSQTQCTCASSPHKYTSCGHVITNNHVVVTYVELRSLLFQEPTFRETRSLNWEDNFTPIIVDAYNYARRLCKGKCWCYPTFMLMAKSSPTVMIDKWPPFLAFFPLNL